MDSHDQIPTNLPRLGLGRLALFVFIAAVAFAIAFLVRNHARGEHQRQLLADAQQVSEQAPVVEVISPKPAASTQNISLPGDVEPMQETAIHARVNGYLKRWLVDIDAHVEAGQLLAEIEAPDVDGQLNEARAAVEQAKANVVSAETNSQLAQATYDRYNGLLPTGGVTQQDLDTKRSAAAQAVAARDAARAAVKSAQATVERLVAQQGFEKIVAPFSGTITARNYDVGALVSPNDMAAGHELFRIAQTDKLRVWVNVPQSYVTLIKAGQPVEFSVDNYPGRQFEGIVARSAGMLDTVTRTLRTELDFDNSSGQLWAGMYGQVTFNVHHDQPLLTIPNSALIFNAGGTQVAVVDGTTVHLRKINIARDMGTSIEIGSGISADDLIVSNPGEALSDGIQVQVASRPAKDSAPAEKPLAAQVAVESSSPTTRPEIAKVTQIDPPQTDPPGSPAK
jgi:RND family efflux transporter MFP subunit